MTANDARSNALQERLADELDIVAMRLRRTTCFTEIAALAVVIHDRAEALRAIGRETA